MANSKRESIRIGFFSSERKGLEVLRLIALAAEAGGDSAVLVFLGHRGLTKRQVERLSACRITAFIPSARTEREADLLRHPRHHCYKNVLIEYEPGVACRKQMKRTLKVPFGAWEVLAANKESAAQATKFGHPVVTLLVAPPPVTAETAARIYRQLRKLALEFSH